MSGKNSLAVVTWGKQTTYDVSFNFRGIRFYVCSQELSNPDTARTIALKNAAAVRSALRRRYGVGYGYVVRHCWTVVRCDVLFADEPYENTTATVFYTLRKY